MQTKTLPKPPTRKAPKTHKASRTPQATTILTLLTTLLIATTAANSYALQLSQTNLQLKRGEYSGIEIENEGQEPISVRIEISEETHAGSVAKLPPNFPSCAKGLRALPKLFTLAPGKYQNVKIQGREVGNCRLYFVSDKLEEKDEPIKVEPPVVAVGADGKPVVAVGADGKPVDPASVVASAAAPDPENSGIKISMPVRTGIPVTIKER